MKQYRVVWQVTTFYDYEMAQISFECGNEKEALQWKQENASALTSIKVRLVEI